MSFKIDLSANKHFYYWILPLISTGILVILNHSGVELLQTFVAPIINREFGMLEHLQAIVILVIVVIAFSGLQKRRHWIENLGYLMLGILFIIAFLEELDYGLHYYEYFAGVAPEQKVVERNLHNYNNNEYLYEVRQGIIMVMILVFIILPLAKDKIKIKFIQHFCGDKMLIATFAVYVVIGQMARLFPKLGLPINPSLDGNHQEFEELVSYYMMLLFVYELTVIKRPLFASKNE